MREPLARGPDLARGSVVVNWVKRKSERVSVLARSQVCVEAPPCRRELGVCRKARTAYEADAGAGPRVRLQRWLLARPQGLVGHVHTLGFYML